MTIDKVPALTECDQCKAQTLTLWVVRDPSTGVPRWLCMGCYQKTKELPTLRQLVRERSART